MKEKKILVVDDREIGHVVLKEIVENKEHGMSKWVNCKLIQSYTGKDAVEIIKKENPDLVLMDINMPEIDGLEATRRIRKDYKTLPIIAVTAQAMEDDKEKCLDAGCSDYVSKPYNIQEIINLMLTKLGVKLNEEHSIY